MYVLYYVCFVQRVKLFSTKVVVEVEVELGNRANEANPSVDAGWN